MMPLINNKNWQFILPIVRIIENVIPGKSPQQGKLLQTLVEFNFFHADFFTNIEFIITIIRLCFLRFHLLYPWQPYYARITFLCVAIKLHYYDVTIGAVFGNSGSWWHINKMKCIYTWKFNIKWNYESIFSKNTIMYSSYLDIKYNKQSTKL